MMTSIRTRLTIIFISLVVVPLVLLGFLLTWQTFQSEKQHAAQLVQETAHWVGAEVNSFINEITSHLEIVVQVRGFSNIPFQEQKNILEELMSFHNEFDEVALLNRSGQEFIRVDRINLVENTLLADHADSEIFLSPSASKKTYFGPILFSEATGEPYVTMGVPFFNPRDNSLLGVLTAKVRFKKIWNLISSLQLQQGEEVYIVDSHGRVIAHRNPSVVLRGTRITGLDNSSDAAKLTQQGLSGKEVFLSSYTIPLGARSLHIIAEKNYTEALTLAKRQLNIFLFITFVTISATIVVMVMVAGNIVRPILNLVTVSREIMQGDFTSKADIERKDEIGELAQTFNKMTTQLRHSLHDLHQEVRERTQTQKELQKELQINEAVTSLLRALLSAVKIEDIAQLVLDHARHLTTSEHVSVSLFEQQEGKNHGEALTAIKHQKTTLPPSSTATDHPLFSYKTDKRGPFFINDSSSENIPFSRFLYVPVLIDGELAGHIVLADAKEDYSEKDITSIERLAKMYTLAISRCINEKETEKLENALRQSQKMEAIGTLAGGIAHDFNNVLTPILGYSELIKNQVPADSEISQNIDQVLKATHRASALVRQILTFSREREHEPTNIEIHIIVKEALKLLRASIPSSIAIKQQIDSHCGTVLADPTQMHQVVMNLCTNAYHAMGETGGTLGVSLQPVSLDEQDLDNKLDLTAGEYIRLEVSDTGTGMEKKVLERIFEPYFSTKAEGKGTGLGLSVVHGIVKNHGGELSVYSEPGKGTTFHIYLPKSSAKGIVTETEESLDLTKFSGNESILIVDDEKEIIKIEEKILIKLGYKVTSETDSNRALDLIRSGPEKFDLVITDMTMPNLNGIELARACWKIVPGMPVIICTGYSELLDAEKARETGIDAYITKPVIMQKFASTVRKVLDRRAGRTP